MAFKIVKTHDTGDEVIAQITDFAVCRTAFEKALFIYPNEHLEMRQGARVIAKSKEG